ncbi:uncharacterized protein LOC113516242 isoform X2 [Galleria mellonella]|uniref:Uncharacterized protein LOC113516242 isoform X2 n=1 Tax=Galleria mellonella TaxID=7137 RepID=A0A6J3C1B4_GALME|nr:uncharacterized protein LOC113516242 isoform X2 [Galleria mellonella]
MPQNDALADVVEICALIQCLGFSLKSLETNDANASQDGGGVRTVTINCQEFGCTLLDSLPRDYRERLAAELREMIKCIKQYNNSELNKSILEPVDKSASMVELGTPDKKLCQAKVDTPTRYRSLDALTNPKREAEQPLPAPGPLQRQTPSMYADDISKKTMCRRQSTYTVSSMSGSSVRRRNKTSSPIQSQSGILDRLLAAEKVAEDLRSRLSSVIRDFVEEGRDDSSMSSMILDVSKISILKGETSKAQFASSPNLSGLDSVQEDFPKSRLKRFESASTSNLGPTKQIAKGDGKISRLRRLSPSLFKAKKDSPIIKTDFKATESKSKLNALFRPKIVTPVLTPRGKSESSPNISSSKKKFSHVKSTIPRPTKRE